MDTIKTKLYETAHRGKKSVAQIADETGISANYLYRACLPAEGTGARFPLEYLVPVMKATGDYRTLRHLNSLCGFTAVRVPRYAAFKGDEIELVDDYQQAAVTALKALKTFLGAATRDNYNACLEALDNVMEQTVGAQKYAHKKMAGQMELEL